MNPRYGRRSIGVAPDKKAATTGELRNPIVFLKQERTPDAHTGFDVELKIYGRAWAKVEFSDRKPMPDSGEEKSGGFTHRFIIRHPGWEPALNDLIGWGKSLFRVRSVVTHGTYSEWLRIKTIEDMRTDAEPFGTRNPPAQGQDEGTLKVTVSRVDSPQANTMRQESEFWEASEPPSN